MGLMGVRVSTANTKEGFTLTREDGWFDLMVNGGGAVSLQFGRAPFKPQNRIVHVPWNEVVIIDTVVMSIVEDKSMQQPAQSCLSHDYNAMKPVVLATWKHGFQGSSSTRSIILAESQVVQESFQIPGTDLHLVYHSSRTAGYLSTIKLQLTPDKIPATLKSVHLKITIEGILFERTFEADPSIKFTYSWNLFNIYRRRVYGIATAVVKVGYEYADCTTTIWDIQTTKLSGHDMSISEVGGWNLDIHHRYNFHEGILQKGDGLNLYLKHKPRIVLTTMGDGSPRRKDCADCDGAAVRQRLYSPPTLAAGADGSLYVGDFNLIRKISTDGNVRTILRLNITSHYYLYHMAVSPYDGALYISHPESNQIIKVKNEHDATDLERNWVAVVGSGEHCSPGDEAHCGDNGLAKDAKLAYPKGLAIASDNTLYFADGVNIRMVDRYGIITTLIGNHAHKSHWEPMQCEGTLRLEEIHLRFPTALAINPLDDTLYIVDDHMILKMTPDSRVHVVAGRPLHCAKSKQLPYDSESVLHASLVKPQSIAFGPNGDLFVAESDSQRINRVRVIGTDGRISLYAGAESKCNCQDRGCDCFEAAHYLATAAKFKQISSIAVTPDGVLHIADQANYRIRSVMFSLPEASTSKEYEIYAPDTQEIYVFNRFGQHVNTRNILTGETKYTFTYNVNTSNGKLTAVTDAAGNKINFFRDRDGQVSSIEDTKGQKCYLRMKLKMLIEIATPDQYAIMFEYKTGLLRYKMDSTGKLFVYNYDEFGRLTSAVTPTGKIIDLAFDLSGKGATVTVLENGRSEVSMLIQETSVLTRVGDSVRKAIMQPDGSTVSVTPWGQTNSIETAPYSLLGDIKPLLGESYPVPSKQRTELGASELANRFEWRYFMKKTERNHAHHVVKKLRVNGENLLSLEYDRETQSITVLADDKLPLLNVTYDRSSRPTCYKPLAGDYADVHLEYDRYGQLVAWQWGELQERYEFDRTGHLLEIRYGDNNSISYEFRDQLSSAPIKFTTARRADYLLQYNDAGALQSLTTPRGHIHTFSLQTSLGFFKFQYFAPITRHPFEILYDDDGKILEKIHPHQSGKVVYVYDKVGRLENIVAGVSLTHYKYYESNGLVKSVEILDPDYRCERELKYHSGVLKDETVLFNLKGALTTARYKYQYDGNTRLSAVEMTIDNREIPLMRYKYGSNLGNLEAIGDLKITRNTPNRTVVQDASKQFFTITDFDEHGRVKSVLINIKSLEVFRLELEYDLRNRIKTHKTAIGKQRATSVDKITYNADGHVLEVIGTNNFKYLYDENGNIVGILQQSDRTNLGYDTGDRVIQVSAVWVIWQKKNFGQTCCK